MKLLLQEKRIETKNHDWKHASENFAHLHGVSGIAWCKRCNAEVAQFIGTDSMCIYYDNTYLEEWDGESIVISGIHSMTVAVDKIKKHMMRVIKKLKTAPSKDFQGTTSAASKAFYQLQEEGKIKIVCKRVSFGSSYYEEDLVQMVPRVGSRLN